MYEKKKWRTINDKKMDFDAETPPPDYDSAILMRPGQIQYYQTPSTRHAQFQQHVGSCPHSSALTPSAPASTPTHSNFEPVGLAPSAPSPSPSASPGHVNFQAPNPVGPTPYPSISTAYPHIMIIPYQPITTYNTQPITLTPAAAPAKSRDLWTTLAPNSQLWVSINANLQELSYDHPWHTVWLIFSCFFFTNSFACHFWTVEATGTRLSSSRRLFNVE